MYYIVVVFPVGTQHVIPQEKFQQDSGIVYAFVVLDDMQCMLEKKTRREVKS